MVRGEWQFGFRINDGLAFGSGFFHHFQDTGRGEVCRMQCDKGCGGKMEKFLKLKQNLVKVEIGTLNLVQQNVKKNNQSCLTL